MKIAVVGTGGLGGYYGGRLAHAGEEVHFIARGAQLAALNEVGLRVESVRAPFTLSRVHATDDPASVGPVDLVLFTVKAYGLEAAAEGSRSLVGPGTTVLPLLNGVDISETLGVVLGMAPMLGGLAYVFAYIAEPGLIRQVSPFDRIQFGELAGGTSDRCDRIEETLRHAGIDATQVEDVRAALWSKFLFLSAASGLTALTRQTIGPVRSDPDTRVLFEAAMREVAALAQAKGVRLEPDIVEKSLAFAQEAPPDLRPSMALDLEQQKPLELDALNGTVVRLGQALGVPTPVHACIYAGLKFHRDGGS